MSHQTLCLSHFVGLFIVLIPLGANAGTGQVAGQITGQITCPTLLTETECRDYQTAWHKAQSEADNVLLQDKYAALLNERSRLCPLTISKKEAKESKGSLDTKRIRLFAGRKIGL